MAVSNQDKGRSHLGVAINVVVSIALAVILVGLLQWIAYSYNSRADLTQSSVNTLSNSTRSMLSSLDSDIRLTSLYYETDVEDKDQDRYRTTVGDLLALYRGANRSRIEVQSINPLKDLDARKEVFSRLAELPKFKAESAGHKQVIDTFLNDMQGRIATIVSDELAQLETFKALEGTDARLVAQVKLLYGQIQSDLTEGGQAINDAMASEIPSLGAVTTVIQRNYSSVLDAFGDVIAVGSQIATVPGQITPQVGAFFSEAAEQYAEITKAMEAEKQKIEELPTLTFDEIVRSIQSETANPILVEANGDARVVPFYAVWKSANPQAVPAGGADRMFLGEQKITSAILQLTQKQQPAVVFVRHGGQPLLTSLPMRGQPTAAFAQMKVQLEDANFGVYEWDLATQNTMPEITPPPSRTIFVVLRPTPPMPGQMGQPSQDPPFTPDELESLKKAMGDSPRAIFLAGFLPGMGWMPTTYEYADYLADNWGIESRCERTLFVAEQEKPGEFRLTRDPVHMEDVIFSDNPIATSVAASKVSFPWVSPIDITEKLPEGVKTEKLAWLASNEGLWSIADVAFYAEQLKQPTNPIVKNESDYTGEFTIAAMASKGEGKIIVVGSSSFAEDEVAMATEIVPTSQGFLFRQRNPGNAAFFINSLHWLNDKAKWINLGTPINRSTIAIDRNSGEMKFVRGFVYIIWPGLAMCIGLIVWFVRRR